MIAQTVQVITERTLHEPHYIDFWQVGVLALFSVAMIAVILAIINQSWK